VDVKKPSRLRALVIIVPVIVIVASAVVIGVRYQPAAPIEIKLPTEESSKGNIAIGGAVTNPGVYPYNGQDSLESLLKAAGGTTTNADSTLNLTVPEKGAQSKPQKININRASAWLLEALPGIGTTRAKTIIAYRDQHGPFKNTSELMRVEGIGQALYDQIKDLIAVTD
jgi:competence protein ComEA